MYASYAFADAELTRFSETVFLGTGPAREVVDRSGKRSPFAPRHLMNVWSSKQLGGGFGLAAGLRLVGEQFTAEDNANVMGSRTGLLDAAVFYRTNRLRASRVNLKNLTGRGVRDPRLRRRLRHSRAGPSKCWGGSRSASARGGIPPAS